jgi:hypothetical protein
MGPKATFSAANFTETGPRQQEPDAMSAWHEFYDMVGGAAATLLGLLFVSVSLNAEIILGGKNKHSKRLAEQAFQNYIGVLVISLVILVPGITAVDFGNSLLWMSLVWGCWVVVRAFQSAVAHPAGISRFMSLRRFLVPIVAFGLLVYAGFWMAKGQNGFEARIAIGVILLLVSATTVSWELLIKIAEEKYASHET